MTDETLSEKMKIGATELYYLEEDVKEFIQKLKEEIRTATGIETHLRQVDIGEYEKFIGSHKLFKIIDKLAGSRLTGEEE
jgi:hypothetical protein